MSDRSPGEIENSHTVTHFSHDCGSKNFNFNMVFQMQNAPNFPKTERYEEKYVFEF